MPVLPFAAFGPSRLIVDNRKIRSTINEAGKDRTSALWNLFYPDGILRDINRWIINQMATSKNKKGDVDSQLLFENIKQMLIYQQH